MSIYDQQIAALRRDMNLMKGSQVIIYSDQPRSPSTQSIWRDGTSLKSWDGKNWIDISGSSTILDFTTSVVFSSTAYDNVTWSSGVINIGTDTGVASHSIGSGSFTMTANTFIYWAPDAPTSIQTTTTPATAITSGGIIIAVGQKNSDTGAASASIKTFGNNQNDLITADQIVANAITANKLATTLLYAGSIVLNTNGLIRGGQTAYNTGTGFFLGYSSGAYKLSMGNGSTKAFTYDGTDVALVGGTITGGVVQTGTSGTRVVLESNTFKAYNSSNVLRLQSNGSGFRFTDSSATYNTDIEGGNYTTLPALKVAGAVRADIMTANTTALNVYLHTGQLSFRDLANSLSGTVLSSPNDDTLVLQGTTLTINGKNLYSDGTDLYWNGVKIN